MVQKAVTIYRRAEPLVNLAQGVLGFPQISGFFPNVNSLSPYGQDPHWTLSKSNNNNNIVNLGIIMRSVKPKYTANPRLLL